MMTLIGIVLLIIFCMFFLSMLPIILVISGIFSIFTGNFILGVILLLIGLAMLGS